MVQTVAFYAGIVMGSILLLAVALVWVRKQAFGMGGSVMCLSGIALVGLTVFRTIQFEIDAGRLIAKFGQQIDELNAKVEAAGESVNAVATANADLSRGVATLTSAVTTTSQQFQELADELVRTRTLPEERGLRLRVSVVVPQINPNVLEERA